MLLHVAVVARQDPALVRKVVDTVKTDAAAAPSGFAVAMLLSVARVRKFNKGAVGLFWDVAAKHKSQTRVQVFVLMPLDTVRAASFVAGATPPTRRHAAELRDHLLDPRRLPRHDVPFGLGPIVAAGLWNECKVLNATAISGGRCHSNGDAVVNVRVDHALPSILRFNVGTHVAIGWSPVTLIPDLRLQAINPPVHCPVSQMQRTPSVLSDHTPEYPRACLDVKAF